MTAPVRVLPNPGRLIVNSVGRSSTDGFVSIGGIEGLIAGHDYVFVVSGMIGNPLQQNANLSCCEIAPGIPGILYSQRHRLAIADGNVRFPSERSHPFQMILRVDNWRAGDDFLVNARVWQQDPTLQRPAFEVDALTIQAWDLTELGAANYVFNIVNLGATALEYAGGTGNQLLLSDRLATQGEWLAQFYTQVIPGSAARPYNTWLQHLNNDGWGTFDLEWGGAAHGSASRWIPNSFTTNWYSSGMMVVLNVDEDNKHRIGIKGRSDYGPQSGAQSTASFAAVFAVKVSALREWKYHQVGALGEPIYGVGKDIEWQLTQHSPYAVLTCGVADIGARGGAKSFAYTAWHTSKPLTNLKPLFPFGMIRAEGIPECRAGVADFTKGPNFIRVAGARNPADFPLVLSKIENVGPRRLIQTLTAGNPTRCRTREHHGLAVGQQSRIRPQNTITTPSIQGGLYDVTPDQDREFDIPVATTAAQNAGWIEQINATFLTLFQAHGVQVGFQAQILVNIPQNDPPIRNEVFTATAVTPFMLSIPKITKRPGPGGTIAFLDRSWNLRYWSIVGFAMTADPGLTLRPKEIPGPEVATIPGGEADWGSLPQLVIPPSFAIESDWQKPPGELRNLYGERITWPLLIRPTVTFSLEWRGLTAAQAGTLHAQLDGLGEVAFRTTLPNEAEHAFVLVSPVVTDTDGGANLLHTIRVQAVRLEYLP